MFLSLSCHLVWESPPCPALWAHLRTDHQAHRLPPGGGISSYADNPSGAAQSLVECLDQALLDVPRERHAGTPLYLGATAGMRLLK